MRFGVSFVPQAPVDELAGLARDAEQLGFEDIWLPDHYFARDTYAALTLISDRTDRVRFGPAVASPYLRHPALLASVTATLGEISGGRAMLGIGPGGFEFPTQLQTRIAKPLTATREAIEIIRSLWRNNVTSWEGEAFSVEDAAIDFFDEYDAPIYMAARGPKMLEMSGEVADGVITHCINQTHVDFAVDLVKKGGAARRDKAPTVVSFYIDCYVHDDVEFARDRLRRACVIMAGGTYSDSLIEIYGLEPGPVAHLREAVRARDFDEAERRVTDEMVDAFCLAGPAEMVRAEVDRLAASGVDELIVATNPFHGVEEIREGLAAVAEAIGIAPDPAQG